MTQDRIPLDAGSSRPVVEREAELLPCPFCGGATERVHMDFVCSDCGVVARWLIASVTSHADRLWNRRALPSAPAVEGVERELVERLRARLGGVSSPVMRGDNISIVIAGYFEPGIENDELDDSGTWKQGAIDAADEILDAIHAHYASAISRLVKERDEAKTDHEWMTANRNKWQDAATVARNRVTELEASITRLTALLAEADEVVKEQRFAQFSSVFDFKETAERSARRYQQKREAK